MAFNYFNDGKAPTPLQNGAKSKSSEKSSYIFDENDPLIHALDVAIYLGMPLLLTGSPGTGKTSFAAEVARKLHLDGPHVFNAKTTSSATDLFYEYDALRHFHLVHNTAEKGEDLDLLNAQIIRFTALGKAIEIAQNSEKRSVVLIDEIDKTPRDFPNDLLDVLDGEFSFACPELNTTFKAENEQKPVVIITSNSEKNLPEAFLRRCIYYHIPLTSKEKLLKIVSQKFKKDGSVYSSEDADKLVAEFSEIRKLAENGASKVPATAEFVSWILILNAHNFEVADLSNADSDVLKSSYMVLAKDKKFREILLTRLENMNKD